MDDPFEEFIDRADEKSRRLKEQVDEAGLFVKKSVIVFAYYLLAITFGLYVVFVVYLTVAPILLASLNPKYVNLGAYAYILSAFTYLCHQMPERSFIIAGIPLPVCARCIGIYVGSVFGLTTPFISGKIREKMYSIKLLAFAFTPIGIDGVSQSILGLSESSNIVRFITGIIFGLLFFGYFTSRLLSKNSLFNETVKSKEGLMVVILATLLFTSLAYSNLTEHLSLDYISSAEAITIAIESGKTSGEISTYYIPPKSPLSIHADKFLVEYEDYVLSDLLSMKWTYGEYSRSPEYLKSIENLSFSERHLLGIWVVVESSGRGGGGRFVYSNSPGTYVYIDGYTGGIIDYKTH